MNPIRTTCAALALALLAGAPFGAAEDLRDRVERLERELRELKDELRRREATPAPQPGKQRRSEERGSEDA